MTLKTLIILFIFIAALAAIGIIFIIFSENNKIKEIKRRESLRKDSRTTFCAFRHQFMLKSRPVFSTASLEYYEDIYFAHESDIVKGRMQFEDFWSIYEQTEKERLRNSKTQITLFSNVFKSNFAYYRQVAEAFRLTSPPDLTDYQIKRYAGILYAYLFTIQSIFEIYIIIPLIYRLKAKNYRDHKFIEVTERAQAFFILVSRVDSECAQYEETYKQNGYYFFLRILAKRRYQNMVTAHEVVIAMLNHHSSS